MMNEKRFELVSVCGDFGIIDTITDEVWFFETYESVVKVVDLLNEQDEEIQRWKTLYEIKDKEVTARVDALNEVCEYYLTEAQFKADTDPNEAVHEVINRILNTEVKW